MTIRLPPSDKAQYRTTESRQFLVPDSTSGSRPQYPASRFVPRSPQRSSAESVGSSQVLGVPEISIPDRETSNVFPPNQRLGLHYRSSRDLDETCPGRPRLELYSTVCPSWSRNAQSSCSHK